MSPPMAVLNTVPGIPGLHSSISKTLLRSIILYLIQKKRSVQRRHRLSKTYITYAYKPFSHVHAGVPGGLVGYPRAYQNQWCGFNSYGVHILVGIFLALKKIQAENARSVLATYDENRRAVEMLNPMRDKNEGTYIPGGRRDDTCDHVLSTRSLRVKPPTS